MSEGDGVGFVSCKVRDLVDGCMVRVVARQTLNPSHKPWLDARLDHQNHSFFIHSLSTR